jgi:tetratricopeptide (TPR) repeat protein
MPQVLDLSVTFTPPPAGADPDVLASITLRYDAQGLTHTDDLLTNPLSKQEQADLQWYLEEYWKWPYEGFLSRGKQVEALLPQIGKRLYKAVFGTVEANSVLQAWRLQSGASRQISVISGIPAVLSLPWELLHDEQGFLVLRTRQPVSLIRHLPQRELGAFSTAFEPPLRILLVTARPEDTGFIDPRSTARQLFDEMQEQMESGAVVIEVLRPPTLQALRQRLKDSTHPVHLLHFDGHGTFGETDIHQDGRYKNDGEQGRLAFENTENKLALVGASVLAQVLQDSGVRLAILDACQSAMGSADDAFSSVAARLIQGGVDAVIAMSASVLVASSTQYTGAFYRELARGISVPVAQERARQALHDDPRRHLSLRRRDEEGTPIELRDWWLPHYYQQRPLVFSATKSTRKSKRKQAHITRLNEHIPQEPRYGFNGRSRELLQLERWLGQNKLVVIHGFGGMGKTALAREAADWLTRTGMYQGACFVSFESGQGNTTSLLSQLGFFLGIYNGTYTPDDPKEALSRLQATLKERRTLVIADNLESILPGGEAPLDASERTELWDVLLDLQQSGTGVLLTTRTPAFGDGRLSEGTQVMYLRLEGLGRDDAYQLASSLLTSLQIDRSRTPYHLLQALLRQLGYHPLSVQLVLPALRVYEIWQILQDFDTLLPQFTDDAETGRNRSLLASLSYSLQRLSEEQRVLLSRLAIFEGGATEDTLLAITEMAEADWAKLRKALEQAALLTVEHFTGLKLTFLHFHPVLIPFLRGQSPALDEGLELRYAQGYNQISEWCEQADGQNPIEIRAVVQRELPNLRRAFRWLLESGDLEHATWMAAYVDRFLGIFGLYRERQQMHQQVAEAQATRHPSVTETLPQREFLHEYKLGEAELQVGRVQAACARFQHLLTRIESQSEGNRLSPGSGEHTMVLGQLGRCLLTEGNFPEAEPLFRRAIALSEVLLQHDPENQHALRQQAAYLADLGNLLLSQGLYVEAKHAHEQALQIKVRTADLRGQAISRMQLGMIAFGQGNYPEARGRYREARSTFHALGEPAMEAIAWHQLGLIAQGEQNWSEAERSFRESLALDEKIGDHVGAATTCDHLGQIAAYRKRFGEARGWYQRAVMLDQQADPTSIGHVMSLSNLAGFLVNEVHAGGAQDASRQLEEARRYAEQALAISQTLQSSELWRIFHLLGVIAEMQGRHEAGRTYLRQEREAFASLASNRSRVDQHSGKLFLAIASALNDLQVRAQVEKLLPGAEANGWHISEATHRIWAGERDWQTLVENLDNKDALFVLRVLETLAELQEGREESSCVNDKPCQ